MRTVTTSTEAADCVPIGFHLTGEGPPVLLVHGASSDSRQWAAMVPLLAPTHTVAAMDRRGRGASGPLTAEHSLETECGDIAAVVDGLRARTGSPVHVVGHSSGARFALHAALRTPNMASLVLYEPPPPETITPKMLESLDEMAAAGDRDGILRTLLIEVAGNDDAALEFIRNRPIWPIMVDNALTLPAELRATSRYRFDPAAFAGLEAPTLCLLGGNSGPELARVAGRIAGALPDGRIRTLPGQGHGAMFSAPELLASELRGFYSSIGG